MKKIFLALAALAGTMSMNAQIIEIYKGETLVATYKSNKADRVVIKEAPAQDGTLFSWATGSAIALMNGTNHSKYNYTSGEGNTLSSFALADGETAVTGANIYAVYPYSPSSVSRKVTQTEAETAAGSFSNMLSMWKMDIVMMGESYMTSRLSSYGISAENQAIILAYLKDEHCTFPGVELAGNVIKNVVIPAEQTAIADAVDPQAAVKVAKVDGDNLVFADVCAYVKVTPQFDCCAIALTSKGTEPLAGKVTISYNNGEPTTTVTADSTNAVYLVGTITAGDSYYIAVCPETLASGYTIEFLTADKGTYYAQSTDDKLEQECGSVNDLGEFSTSGTWTHNGLATNGTDNGHSWKLITPTFKMATTLAGRLAFADIPDWGSNWVLPSPEEFSNVYNNGYFTITTDNSALLLQGAGVLKYVGVTEITENVDNDFWTSTPGSLGADYQMQFAMSQQGSTNCNKGNRRGVIFKYTK